MDNSNRWLTRQKSGAGTDEIFQPQWPFYDDNKKKESSIRKESPDELFGKLIDESIAEIQDGYKKELLKVQIQQIILQTKFPASQQCNPNNTSRAAPFSN